MAQENSSLPSMPDMNSPEFLQDVLFDESDEDGYIGRNFVPVRFLGRGSFSIVLECKERCKQRSVAIKVINKLNIKRTSLDLLERESMFLKQIDHPNVVGYYEQRETPNKIYIILELVQGLLLSEMIEQRVASGQPFPEDDIVNIISQLTKGLEYIHQKGIIHRDLKPENIIVKVCGSMQVKIIDFGLSFQKTQHSLISQQGCGTLVYMAPEVVFRRQYNQVNEALDKQKVDLWSLGVIQYVLYHPGRHPIWDTVEGRKSFLLKLTKYDEEAVQFGSNMSEQVYKLGRSFFQKTVAKKPEDRMTATQAIQHPWISGVGMPTPITMKDLIKEVERIKKVEQMFKALLFFEYLVRNSERSTQAPQLSNIDLMLFQPSLADYSQPTDSPQQRHPSIDTKCGLLNLDLRQDTKASSPDQCLGKAPQPQRKKFRTETVKLSKFSQQQPNLTPQRSQQTPYQTPYQMPSMSFSSRKLVVPQQRPIFHLEYNACENSPKNRGSVPHPQVKSMHRTSLQLKTQSQLSPTDRSSVKWGTQAEVSPNDRGSVQLMNSSVQTSLKTQSDSYDSPKNYIISKARRHPSQTDTITQKVAIKDHWQLCTKTEQCEEDKFELPELPTSATKISLPQLKKSKFSIYATNVQKKILQTESLGSKPSYHLQIMNTRKHFFP